MKNSLRVVLCQEHPDLAIELEFDEYIPLRLRTSGKPLACGYLRLGGNDRTLAELKVELFSQVLRALTLTLAPRLSIWPHLEIRERTPGLPTLATSFEDPAVINLDLDFHVSVAHDAILVHWGPLASCDSCYFKNVDFLIHEGLLVGALFRNLDKEQLDRFLIHFPRS